MKKYWFQRFEDLSHEELKEKVDYLYSIGYNGILIPYTPSMQDPFTKIARIIDDKDFLYIVAIRPHTISPQYLKKICRSINSIYPSRLAINFVSGYIDDNQKEYGGTIQEPNDLSSQEKRTEFLYIYLKEFNNLFKKRNIKIFVSGQSKKTVEIAKKYSDSLMIRKTSKNFKEIDFDKILSTAILIRNSEDECISFIKDSNKEIPNDLIYGTKQSVLFQINELIDSHTFGILVHAIEGDKDLNAIHDVVFSI